jgi:dTDP-4-dehydrorhamnose reductase
MLGNQVSGLFHAGGPRALTLYQIAQVINRVGGYDPKLLMGCPRAAAGPIPPRAGDVSMDSSRLTAALGYPPLDAWPFDERWAPAHEEWHFDREPGEHGCPELLAEVLYRNPLRRAARSA